MYGFPPSTYQPGFQAPQSYPTQPMPMNPQVNPQMAPQMPLQPQYRPPIVKGRVVTSLEEVKASQVDFDGSMTYFPCIAENCIYTKCIDLNGLPSIQKYVIEQPLPAPQYVTMEQVDQRLLELLGGNSNEPKSKPNDDNVDVKPIKQSYGVNANNARK